MPPKLISDSMLELFPQRGRSPGRHVSSAIHKVMQSIYPDRFDPNDPIDVVRANLGNAMERAIIEALAREHPDRYVIPGELVHEGIHGTPDLWDLEEWAVVEIKLTWASSRRVQPLEPGPDEESGVEDTWFWRYWQQGKSYAKMSSMHRVKLIIIFVVGDWRSAKPEGYQWAWDFTDEELDEAWELVKTYA